MKWLFRAVLVAALFAAGQWAWKKFHVTDAQRVERLISSLARAAETGNLLVLEDGLAQDYTDDFGADKSTVIGYIRSWRAQYETCAIVVTELKIELRPKEATATATLTAQVAGKLKAATVASEPQGGRLHLTFRKSDGKWKLVRLTLAEA